MKIALCLEYPIDLRGGVSVIVETLAIELIRLGHKVTIVSPDTPEVFKESKLASSTEHIARTPAARFSPAQARQLARSIATSGIDIAHFHLGGNFGWGNRYPFNSPIYFLHRLGVPCASTSHQVVNVLDGYCGPQKPLWVKLLLLPIAWLGKAQQLSSVHFEAAVSQHDCTKLKQWYAPFARRFATIYHSRLDSRILFAPDSNREPVILNVAHIARRKGQVKLTEAFVRVADRHPAWILQFIGPDSGDGSVQEIKSLAKTHGLEARIAVFDQRHDAFDLMRKASIYVQPSVFEALGLALQEALYCGCPAIGSRVGGIPELIDEGENGLLVAPDDTDQMEAALIRLITDESLRRKFGARAHASIEEKGMTAARMAENYLQLYDSILTAK